jgi:uncharacterized membrane protein (DUF106 family)
LRKRDNKETIIENPVIVRFMGALPFLDPIREAITTFIIEIGVTTPPWSAVFLLLVSMILSSITGGLNRVLLNMEELQEKSDEMKKHQDLKKKAMETADKKLWIRVKRNEERFLELQRETMMKRMLPSFITMGPFIFVFTTLREAFQQAENFALNLYCNDGSKVCDIPQTRDGALVVLPFRSHDLPLLGSWFSPYTIDPSISVAGFGFWYFLSAIIVSTLVQRLFGINITGMQNPGQTGGLR